MCPIFPLLDFIYSKILNLRVRLQVPLTIHCLFQVVIHAAFTPYLWG
jgi:hypothetical protein